MAGFWKTFIAATATLLVSLGAAARADDAVTINGAGATFPYPAYSKWFDEYRKVDPKFQFNYQSIGSGGGIRQVTAGTVDFGASDAPMTDDQLKEFEKKRGGKVLHFPTALGGVVACYNVPGVDGKIKFTSAALAGIFMGKITKWNDAELTKANPDIKLPATDIVVVRRADGSGTTYVFADYLAKVSADWKKDIGVGTSLKWPVGIGGKGNEGVSALVKQTVGAIGYVELIYATQNKIAYGAVQNAAGKFVDAELKSVTAAAGGAIKDMPEDFRVSITNSAGDDVYPIASFTWLLVPEKISDPVKREAIVKFLKWSLDQGQEILEPLHFSKLPKEVIEKEKKLIETIK
jgi:phosphate transport system substrate-binding protein